MLHLASAMLAWRSRTAKLRKRSFLGGECIDMKPFNNCHEAGDGDLYRRDEEGAFLRGYLGLLDDAIVAVVAPRS